MMKGNRFAYLPCVFKQLQLCVMYILTMCKFLIVALLYFSVSFKIYAEVFSSISKIELLLSTQKNVIDTVQNFIKRKNNKSKILINHLHRFESEHQKAMMDIPRYLGNPVNCYRLIKRLTMDLKLIEAIIYKTSRCKRNASLTYPSQVDLYGATEGLTRLKSVYGLNRSQIAAGLWKTSYGKNKTTYIEKFNPMTISDCYELGKILYDFKYYVDSVGWLMEARKKYNDDWKLYPEDENINLEDIISQANKGFTSYELEAFNFRNWLREISVNITYVKNIKQEVLLDCFKNDFKPSEAVKCVKYYQRYIVSSPNKNVTYQHIHESYTPLCRGKIRNREKKVYENMKCYLAHGPHPFLKLAPIKAEHLHRNPTVTMFYDVISDTEIEALKSHVLPRFKRGTITIIEDKANYTYSRTCQSAEAMSNESIVAAQIKVRIEQFSGMKLSRSEELQVINYGIGGHCALHHDYWVSDSQIEQMGQRIATVLLYMSEVEQGGATIFPVLGTTVFPTKGAALYWDNLLSSGQANPEMYHAGCPVLRGSKWTVTQWINLRGQELSKPCPFNSNPATHTH